MKILLVNKFLYPKGGTETYLFRLGDLLKRQGHQVEYFGMADQRNLVGNSAEEEVSAIDFSTGIRKNWSAPLRVIYCREALRKLYRVLETFQPDVVHFNNIQYHLTPSVLLAVRDYRRKYSASLRVLSTAHDYQLICPNHSLLDSKGECCERCLNRSPVHCLRRKCVKNSYLKSLLAVIDAVVWKCSKAYDELDYIICPSEFMKNKLECDKRFRGKCIVLHNFIEKATDQPIEKEDYVLEFGHLSEEKGTLTVLEAAKMLPDIPFVFAGFGPAEVEIDKVNNAKFVGFLSGKELEDLIRKARMALVPSLWHENCPYSILESQMLGTVVLGSRMGGIPELLRYGEAGLLFEEGNSDDLAEKIEHLWKDEDLQKRLIAKGRIPLESTESYYNSLMKLYGGQHEML